MIVVDLSVNFIQIECHDLSLHYYHPKLILVLYEQQMEPAKQAKIMQEFQKQSAQMDMTVSCH